MPEINKSILRELLFLFGDISNCVENQMNPSSLSISFSLSILRSDKKEDEMNTTLIGLINKTFQNMIENRLSFFQKSSLFNLSQQTIKTNSIKKKRSNSFIKGEKSSQTSKELNFSTGFKIEKPSNHRTLHIVHKEYNCNIEEHTNLLEKYNQELENRRQLELQIEQLKLELENERNKNK